MAGCPVAHIAEHFVERVEAYLDTKDSVVVRIVNYHMGRLGWADLGGLGHIEELVVHTETVECMNELDYMDGHSPKNHEIDRIGLGLADSWLRVHCK
jgi:hypothetical protein